ncbi:hypothetical protein [Ruminococcus sp.]|uniref:hypothetical protein n=1 Tax=Ruminococcus sp. TaxID=41978 RepID=UPI0025ECA4FB|nr:hypothetical protein [Ruminococcus sp.]MBQ8966050.1 hypothetical protein [Ruminococcus sp.]
MLLTLLSVEYAYGLEQHLESSCPESDDNCRMVLRCCEYNYGDDAANIPVHSRHCPFAVLVRDDEASPWRVTEHGYI